MLATTKPEASSSDFIPRKEVFYIASNHEGDMHEVYDIALIRHELMSTAGPIDAEMMGRFAI